MRTRLIVREPEHSGYIPAANMRRRTILQAWDMGESVGALQWTWPLRTKLTGNKVHVLRSLNNADGNQYQNRVKRRILGQTCASTRCDTAAGRPPTVTQRRPLAGP